MKTLLCFIYFRMIMSWHSENSFMFYILPYDNVMTQWKLFDVLYISVWCHDTVKTLLCFIYFHMIMSWHSENSFWNVQWTGNRFLLDESSARIKCSHYCANFSRECCNILSKWQIYWQRSYLQRADSDHCHGVTGSDTCHGVRFECCSAGTQ